MCLLEGEEEGGAQLCRGEMLRYGATRDTIEDEKTEHRKRGLPGVEGWIQQSHELLRWVRVEAKIRGARGAAKSEWDNVHARSDTFVITHARCYTMGTTNAT